MFRMSEGGDLSGFIGCSYYDNGNCINHDYDVDLKCHLGSK